MRQKNRKGKYKRKIFLRVTERDYHRIKTYADKERLSIPAFIVRQSTTIYLPATDEKLLLAIHNLLTNYIAQLRGIAGLKPPESALNLAADNTYPGIKSYTSTTRSWTTMNASTLANNTGISI